MLREKQNAIELRVNNTKQLKIQQWFPNVKGKKNQTS